MTDLVARLVAALHEVRTSTPRECDEHCRTGGDFLWHHGLACDVRFNTRVDARLAAAMWIGMVAAANAEAAFQRGEGGAPEEAAVAAFLAAAAQEVTR